MQQLPHHPYEDFQPTPFKYAEDVKRDQKFAFVVGGENSDDVILNMSGITGVDISILEKRAKPKGKPGEGYSIPLMYLKIVNDSPFPSMFGNGQKKDVSHWERSSQIWNRMSGDGFLDREQNFRDPLKLKESRRATTLILIGMRVPNFI